MESARFRHHRRFESASALAIDPSTPSGLLQGHDPPRRPAGAVVVRVGPHPIRRAGRPAARPMGLLLLMSTLSRQVQYGSKTPAVALCVAFQRS